MKSEGTKKQIIYILSWNLKCEISVLIYSFEPDVSWSAWNNEGSCWRSASRHRGTHQTDDRGMDRTGDHSDTRHHSG